jgi:formate-dependent nitrite reductase cytochrome c552 subunit
MATWAVLGGAVLMVPVLFSLQGGFDPDSSREYASRSLPPEPAPVLLAAPEIDDEYLPCADCHESGDVAEREVRELDDEHDEMDFAHGDLWCYSCHDPNPRQRQNLRLADDTNVPFEDSWRLCTQCHAKKLPDWRAGVHGKRTGHWWGPKEYRTCVVCHDPHDPPFKPIEPMPPPRRPEAIASKEPRDEAS